MIRGHKVKQTIVDEKKFAEETMERVRAHAEQMALAETLQQEPIHRRLMACDPATGAVRDEGAPLTTVGGPYFSVRIKKLFGMRAYRRMWIGTPVIVDVLGERVVLPEPMWASCEAAA